MGHRVWDQVVTLNVGFMERLRFFDTLKSEFFYLNKFNDLDELHAGIDEYIQYYNHSRTPGKGSPDNQNAA